MDYFVEVTSYINLGSLSKRKRKSLSGLKLRNYGRFGMLISSEDATMRRIFLVKKMVLGMFVAVLVFPAGLTQAFSHETIASKMRADALLKRGRIEAAVSLYEKAVQKEPGFANSYYNLATAYYLKGNIRKALENLETFVSLRPTDAEALYNLGSLKFRIGAFEEAQGYFQRAQDCPSSVLLYQKITQALDLLKGLRQNPETQKLLAYLLTT